MFGIVSGFKAAAIDIISISKKKFASSKMQRGEIVKAGYLTKSPPDKPMAQWHKRWFVLLDSKLVYPLAPRCVRLVYYQSEMEAKKLGNPKGMRTLASWQVRCFDVQEGGVGAWSSFAGGRASYYL